MKITLEIDTDCPVTEYEKGVLLALAGSSKSDSLKVDVQTKKQTDAKTSVGYIAPEDSPESGSISTLAEISNLGFGETKAPEIDTASMGFGNAMPSTLTPPPPPPSNSHIGVPPPLQVTANAAQVDKTGLPYDPRIHSTPAKMNADDTWRKRKNVEQAEYDRVANELRGIMSTPQTPVVHAAPPPPPASTLTPPPPPPASTLTPPPPPNNKGEFTKMMLTLTPLLEDSGMGGKLKQTDVEFLARNHGMIDDKGVGQVAMFQHRPDLIAPFLAACINHASKYV